MCRAGNADVMSSICMHHTDRHQHQCLGAYCALQMLPVEGGVDPCSWTPQGPMTGLSLAGPCKSLPIQVTFVALIIVIIIITIITTTTTATIITIMMIIMIITLSSSC